VRDASNVYRTVVVGTDASDSSLLAVGNRGLAGIEGRLLGSVPADATRRTVCDVLVVHTTD
jgi:nucleotide-binding universal stress UspA family protein